MIHPPEERTGGTHTMHFEQSADFATLFSFENPEKVIFRLSQ
jgi:hypothetical protein